MDAFEEAKRKLSSATLLHHPTPFSATSLTVDASEFAVGAELAQRGPDQSWRPIAFFLHTLTVAEKKYSAFDRELLAIYLSIRHFRHFLEGRKFVVFTDHKPLTTALSSNSDARSPRQTRHLSWISEYTMDIRYIRGERNVVADALSRPSPVISSLQFPQLPSVDLHAMSKVQDPSGLISASSLDLKQVKFNGSVLWCDTSRGRLRPCLLYTSPSPRD